MLEQIHFKNQQSFRNWLKENHDKSNGIWMLYYKKHTKKTTIEYSDALNEALCFGWIDSIIKRVDEERYVRKFTPRKNTKNWSEVNKVKVMKLIEQERMTLAGLQKIDSYLKTGNIDWSTKSDHTDDRDVNNPPEYICKVLKENPPAWEHFQAMTDSYKRNYIGWIENAKQDKTKQNRLNKVIERLKENLKPGLM